MWKKDTLCDQNHSKCESVKLNFDSWSLNYVFEILRTTCLKLVVSADVKTDVYKKKKLSKIQKKNLKIRLLGKVGSLRSNVKKSEYLPGGAESLHLLFSVWHSGYTYPLSLKGAPLSTPLKSLGTNATPEYYPN